ncbi:hypothetical protein, partial [Ruminococcus callidus]
MEISRWDIFKLFLFEKGQPGKAVLFAFPRKSVDFLTLFSVCPKHGTEISLSADSDQGFSPWTSPAFLKNCWTEKLYSPVQFSPCVQRFVLRQYRTKIVRQMRRQIFR